MSELIGRDHPTALLAAEVRRTADSHGGLVLVGGEAGIGKTALATAAAEHARRSGALVLGGSCWDSDGAPGLWPWVQVLRALQRAATPGEWAEAEAAAGGALPVLLGRAGGEEPPAEGFRMFDTVTSVLVQVSRSRPVVVVLDDLHRADAASLRLLAFAVGHAWFERLLLLGTYRDAETDIPGHPLQQHIAPLIAKATTITLTGLGRDDVGALMARTTGRVPAPALVAEVHRRTGGNPFFVEETARLWHAGGTVTAIAPGVREAVRSRIALLPGETADVLATAAVLGREFRADLLAAVRGHEQARIDRRLAEAVAARLVAVREGGTHAFAHDLVRETLYDTLDDAPARHAAVVRALDARPDLGHPVLPADLARHAHLAGDELDPGRAVAIHLAAARDASGRMALDEAVTHFRRALGRVRDDRRRIDIALKLAAVLDHNGDPAGAWRHIDDAVATARRIGDPELLARAAVTAHRHSGPARPPATALLREAHRALVGRGDPEAQGLGADRMAQEIAVRAAVLARRGKDDEALGFSLWARHDSIWGPGTAPERLALTDEMIDVGRRVGDLDMELNAQAMRWVALLELGDPAYLDQYRTFVTLAAHHRITRFDLAALIDGSLVSSLTGDFAKATRLLDEAVSGRRREPDAHPWGAYLEPHLRWALLLLQGRHEELHDLHARDQAMAHPHPQLLAAITAVETGDTAFALRHLRRVLASSADPYPRVFAPLWLRLQAQVAAATGDPELCARAAAGIAPHRDTWTVSLFGCDLSGPMSLWAAEVDAALGDYDAAVNGFTDAARSADLLGARPWAVEARRRLASALAARGGPGDHGAAARALATAESEAAALGMRHIPARAAPVRAALDRAGAGPGTAAANGRTAGPAGPAGPGGPGGSRGTAPACAFRRDGAVWTLTYAGVTAHLPDAKGLRDLHHLLGRPGTDVPAAELLDPAAGPELAAARGLGADPVLDDAAKAAYRRRLATLDDDIDRAAARGDSGRAAELDRERAALIDELRTAAGLGGRDRRLGDEAERARKTVTARIRDTLRRIDARHPQLAAHLRESVTTGVRCAYRPAADAPRWRL